MFSCLSILLLTTPFKTNRLLKQFSSFIFCCCIFSLSQLLWLFPCSLLTPGDIFWPPHFFLSASTPLVFAIYGCLSRCCNCPLLDIYQIWMQRWMNNYFDWIHMEAFPVSGLCAVSTECSQFQCEAIKYVNINWTIKVLLRYVIYTRVIQYDRFHKVWMQNLFSKNKNI